MQRLDLYKQLKLHKGCVNTVTWNDTGEYLLSGSDDQTIVISNPFTGRVEVQYKTAHRANIFSAKFLPQSSKAFLFQNNYLSSKTAFSHIDDRGIVSCSGDGVVLHTELTPEPQQNYFNCHSSGTTYEVLTVPSMPDAFMSCGEDGTVRLFDLRHISR